MVKFDCSFKVNNFMRLHTLTETTDKLVLVKLPYEEKELEPVMDRDVVRYHYHVLSKGYVDRFNSGDGDPVFNKAGALLHNLWWVQLQSPKSSNVPAGAIKELIDNKYGSFSDFKDQFKDESMKLQGSGWCYIDSSGDISTLKNQTWKKDIIMLIDLWEHAANPYHTRKEYLRTIWQIINWDVVNDRLTSKS